MKKIFLSLLLIFALIFSASGCAFPGSDEPSENPTVAYEVLNNTPLSAFCKMLAPNPEGWKVRSSRRSDQENAMFQANQVTQWKIVS